jgi:hypothetical protein
MGEDRDWPARPSFQRADASDRRQFGLLRGVQQSVDRRLDGNLLDYAVLCHFRRQPFEEHAQ